MINYNYLVLEKVMATHSSVLAWRIPGMGEPGGLLSMGSHRVGPQMVKNLPGLGLISGSRRSPEKESGFPLQYSCLETSMGRGAW